MVFPLLAMGIGAGLEGLQWGLGGIAARKGKRRMHRYRDILGAQAQERFAADAPLIQRAKERAGEVVRGGMRSRGIYSPDVAAVPLARLETQLGETLAARKAQLEGESLDKYMGMRSQLEEAPMYDPLRAFGMGVNIAGSGMTGENWNQFGGQQGGQGVTGTTAPTERSAAPWSAPFGPTATPATSQKGRFGHLGIPTETYMKPKPIRRF